MQPGTNTGLNFNVRALAKQQIALRKIGEKIDRGDATAEEYGYYISTLKEFGRPVSPQIEEAYKNKIAQGGGGDAFKSAYNYVTGIGGRLEEEQPQRFLNGTQTEDDITLHKNMLKKYDIPLPTWLEADLENKRMARHHKDGENFNETFNKNFKKVDEVAMGMMDQVPSVVEGYWNQGKDLWNQGQESLSEGWETVKNNINRNNKHSAKATPPAAEDDTAAGTNIRVLKKPLAETSGTNLGPDESDVQTKQSQTGSNSPPRSLGGWNQWGSNLGPEPEEGSTPFYEMPFNTQYKPPVKQIIPDGMEGGYPLAQQLGVQSTPHQGKPPVKQIIPEPTSGQTFRKDAWSEGSGDTQNKLASLFKGEITEGKNYGHNLYDKDALQTETDDERELGKYLSEEQINSEARKRQEDMKRAEEAAEWRGDVHDSQYRDQSNGGRAYRQEDTAMFASPQQGGDLIDFATGLPKRLVDAFLNQKRTPLPEGHEWRMTNSGRRAIPVTSFREGSTQGGNLSPDEYERRRRGRGQRGF